MVILLVGSFSGRNSSCGEALGLKLISVWNPMSVCSGMEYEGASSRVPYVHEEICGEPPWS